MSDVLSFRQTLFKRNTNLPRKSLTEGDSPRITLRMNNEILTILDEIDKNKRSAFIREAIIHYASSSAYRRKTSTSSYLEENTVKKTEEKEQPSIPVKVYTPAWKR